MNEIQKRQERKKEEKRTHKKEKEQKKVNKANTPVRVCERARVCWDSLPGRLLWKELHVFGVVHHHPVLVPELRDVSPPVVLPLHFRITGHDLRNALLPAEQRLNPTVSSH